MLTLRFPNGPCIFHYLRGFESFQSPTAHTGSPYTEYSTDQDIVLASDIFHCSAFLALYKSSKIVGKLQYNAYPQPLQGNFPARHNVLLNFSIVKFISRFPSFPASLISSIYRSAFFLQNSPALLPPIKCIYDDSPINTLDHDQLPMSRNSGLPPVIPASICNSEIQMMGILVGDVSHLGDLS